MNNTMELPYPEWQGPLQAAVLEFDREKLSEKVLKAEARILERLRQLEVSNNGHNEREALSYGLSLLKRIRRDRLGLSWLAAPMTASKATPNKIKVLLADDSHVMRKAICQHLCEDPDIELVAEARSYSELLDLAHRLKPRVIVLDAHMIDTANVETTAKTLTSVSRVIAISASSDDETKILADSVGASVLLDKMDLYHNLIPAIKQSAA
jgi:CheY-like chemotaxis protein